MNQLINWLIMLGCVLAFGFCIYLIQQLGKRPKTTVRATIMLKTNEAGKVVGIDLMNFSVEESRFNLEET